MKKLYQYKAFGFVIHSEFSIAQLPDFCVGQIPDITIVQSDLTMYHIGNEHYRRKKDELFFGISNIGKFRITNGSQIEVHPEPECTEAHLGVFLMGSCMGAVLHQRGFLPIHGSCITDGKKSILLTGDSGAGKSTLASEFLSHGWRLLTDDVSAVYDIHEIPKVQASYPSQKLWQDSLKQYRHSQKDIHSLYFHEEREKFGVNVEDFFYDGSSPLKLIIRLCPSDEKSAIHPLEGIICTDQILKNIYRSYMILPQEREAYFRKSVELSNKVWMALVTREKNAACAGQLYEMIINYLEEKNNEQKNNAKA